MFTPILRQEAQAYGWKEIVANEAGAVFQVPKPGQSRGRAVFGRMLSQGHVLTIPVAFPRNGPYRFVIAGDGIASTIVHARLGTQAAQMERLGADALAVKVDAASGDAPLVLELREDWRYAYVEPTPIRLIVGAPEEDSGTYFAIERP